MHNTAAIETINFQDQIRIQSQWIGWLRRKWLAVVAVATKTTTFIATFEKKFQRSSLWIQFSPTLSYSHHHWMSINLPTFIHNMYESIYPIWTSVRVCAPSCVCVCVYISYSVILFSNKWACLFMRHFSTLSYPLGWSLYAHNSDLLLLLLSSIQTNYHYCCRHFFTFGSGWSLNSKMTAAFFGIKLISSAKFPSLLRRWKNSGCCCYWLNAGFWCCHANLNVNINELIQIQDIHDWP